MDGTTPINLLKPSRSTLTGWDSSGYGNTRFSQADEPHNTPIPAPPAQPRPHPQRRLSEYVAMVMALDSIPVGLSSILINTRISYLRLVGNICHTGTSFHMDLVGGFLGAACDFPRRVEFVEVVAGRHNQWCASKYNQGRAGCIVSRLPFCRSRI